jgi:chromosome partitioning protein
MPFFSMVQQQKKLHRETIKRIRKQYKGVLSGDIPFSSDIEKMGIHRAPVASFARNRPAAKAYQSLWGAVEKKVFK